MEPKIIELREAQTQRCIGEYTDMDFTEAVSAALDAHKIMTVIVETNRTERLLTT